MPALDQCHPKVVRALQKAGWAVDNKPATLSAQERTVFIDIRARRLTNGITQQILLAEVKCFADKNSRTTDLYTTIGQYLVYRTLLEEAEVIIPLYLAIPEEAFTNVFDSTILRITGRNQVKMLIVSLDQEIIVQWIE